MDRQGYKKIIAYVLIWFILISILTIGLGITVKMVVQIHSKQMVEMTVMHPEQAFELKESFHYYQEKVNTSFIYFWIFLVGLSILSFSLCYLFQTKNSNKEKWEIINNLKLLWEQLEQYKKGNYNMQLSFVNKGSFNTITEEWIKVESSLRELGYYFNSLKEKLDKEENSTKTLITDISHQLKTPLTSLRMSHELSQEMELSYEERLEFLKQEEYEIHKLESLLEELVNLSRLENHMIQIKPELLGIKETLTQAVNQVFMKAYSKDIKIQVDMEEDLKVNHDLKWTVEAISNVLDNAIKYSNAGSRVLINVHKLPNLVLIEIEDEGIGIPTEELHKIFQRFYRGINARSKVKEGAGIGLYLTRRILEEQGGTITAKRKQNNGTIFRITLPII
jgi:signal transduction histidine kinase